MNPLLYARLAEFVRIDHSSKRQEVGQLIKISAGSEIFDINQADSALLEKLPGIGPVLARRIIKYRYLLGGFYDTQQLREVYGISDSIFLIIRSKVITNPGRIKIINLNLADEKSLSLHPYIGKYAAQGIIKYRMQVQIIKDINELYINGLIQEDKLEKLKNYVTF